MNLWDKILEKIQQKLDPHSFNTWFRPTVMVANIGQTLQVKVPNDSFKAWLTENYQDLIAKAIDELQESNLSVNFFSGDGEKSDPVTPEKSFVPQHRNRIAHEGFLNPKYSFNNFVIGDSNQFAHAATMAVAESPSKRYNPLFLYGGVGLGKTHLMHAAGHFVIEHYPHLKVAYVTSEKFMNDLINSIRYDKTFEFREKYRTIDILLMDDIQFLAGKERTQMEFFHTFNDLYEAQKQIVISSDSPPKEIPALEERLLSRFEWGLIADIEPPDQETKVAILRKKAEMEKITLPDNVAMFIASKIKSNIRELEGCLIRVIAFSSLTGNEINIDLAKEILKDIIKDTSVHITPERILKFIADYYKLKPLYLKSKSNAKKIAFPRQIAMYLCKQLTPLSLPEIGRSFGGKHHSTVIHSIKKIDHLRKKDPDFNNLLNSFNDSLR